MISVIIPCYNSVSTIRKCIQSVLNQTFNDVEIIVVNDCSTDKSMVRLLDLQKKFPQKIVLLDKKKNEGVDHARFDGLKIAKGDFITFLDADDWLEKKALEIMYSEMSHDDYDYVEIEIQRVMGRLGLIRKRTSRVVKGEITLPELFDRYYLSFFGVNILSVNIWGKLYRKSFLDSLSLKPSGLAMGEDLYFNLSLFPYLKKIKIIDYVGYNYRFGGMTTKYNPHLLSNLECLYSRKRELAEQYKYIKAIPFLLIELKNVLKSDIKQRIVFRYGNKSDMIIDMKKLFHEKTSFQEVWAYYKNTNHKDCSEFVTALREQNFERMYDACFKEVQAERNIRIIKGVVNTICKYI